MIQRHGAAFRIQKASSLKHQCHVSEGCSALQLRAKETWKLGCACVSARTHSYGIRALTVCFPYRIMCVISNMCQAMCSLFTNYLISPVCSLRYRQCSISLFPAFRMSEYMPNIFKSLQMYSISLHCLLRKHADIRRESFSPRYADMLPLLPPSAHQTKA